MNSARVRRKSCRKSIKLGEVNTQLSEKKGFAEVYTFRKLLFEAAFLLIGISTEAKS